MRFRYTQDQPSHDARIRGPGARRACRPSLADGDHGPLRALHRRLALSHPNGQAVPTLCGGQAEGGDPRASRPHQNSWDCRGLATLTTGTGRAFKSNCLLGASQALGFGIQFKRLRSTWLKGKIESGFRSIEWSLLEALPPAAFFQLVDGGCPNGKLLRTSGTVHDGRVRNYLSQPQDCRTGTLKHRCTRGPFKKVARDINEDARNHARLLKGTPEFEPSSDARKKVEMRFAHLKVQHGFERMRLRGLTGARDEITSPPFCRTSRQWRSVYDARQKLACAPRSPNRSAGDCAVRRSGLRRPGKKPKTPPDSKTSYRRAFFDSIDSSRK